jgi:hypothetical protein
LDERFETFTSLITKISRNIRKIENNEMAEVWVDNISMPVIDCLGDEFLEYVKDGMEITIKEDGIVEVK